MRIDSTLTFLPLGSAFSLVGGAGMNLPLPNVIDLLGVGVGQAPPSIIGNATLFGEDVGVGGDKQVIQATIGTAVTTADACTLNLALQVAPDLGVAGGYQPGTWQTINETGPMTAAQLTAGQVIRMDWAPVFPPTLRPRFVRLLAQVPAAEVFTAGTLSNAFVTRVRDDQSNKQAAANYVVK